jgi:antagonist of KipI
MIHVESPGLLTTVQDLGRHGHGVSGVSPAGAADPVSLRIANLLVGNPANTAALEMTLVGGRYRFEVDARVVLTGAPVDAIQWAAFDVRAGDVLDIGPAHDGARMYLGVRGGVDVPLFLGSASTHLLAGLGGHEGRALRRGDVLRIGASDAPFLSGAIGRETLARLAPRKTLRVTYGPQVDWFSDLDRAKLVITPYTVTQQVDRMGIRLEGTPLKPNEGQHMITEGVPLGAVQIPAGGQPIILFVDQQTTGGYPKIANVISADLASIGQLRPGDEVRFEWVTIATAHALLREQESLMASLFE